MSIISSNEFPQVRAVLDVSLDTTSLPDEVITQDIYQGRAEREVLAYYPTAESFTGENKDRAKLAVILLTAAYLAPAVVRVTSVNVQGRDSNYSRKTFDPDLRADELREQAIAELELIDTGAEVEIADEAGPTIIMVSTQGRGKYL